VLIIEGPLTAELADWLMVEGYEVMTARVADVVQRVHWRPFVAVIVDIWAPGMEMTAYRKLLDMAQVPLFVVLPPLASHHRVTFVPLAAPHGRFAPLLQLLNERLGGGEPLAAGAGSVERQRVRVGDVEIDLARWQVMRGRREISLTPTEFRFLLHLITNAHRAVSYDELLQAIWGYPSTGAGDHKLVVNLASRLRRKLGEGVFRNVRGYGYRLRSYCRTVQDGPTTDDDGRNCR